MKVINGKATTCKKNSMTIEDVNELTTGECEMWVHNLRLQQPDRRSYRGVSSIERYRNDMKELIKGYFNFK